MAGLRVFVYDTSPSALKTAGALRADRAWNVLSLATATVEPIPTDCFVLVVPAHHASYFRSSADVLLAYGDQTACMVGVVGKVDDVLVEPWSVTELQFRAAQSTAYFAALLKPGAVLTMAQRRLLRLLFHSPDHFVSRQTAKAVLSDRQTVPCSRSLDMSISRLRRALRAEAARVRAIYGRGYQIELPSMGKTCG